MFKKRSNKDTSSVKVESLAIWDEDDECGIIDPVKEPFSKLDMKWEVGADPLPASDSWAIFWVLGELRRLLKLEFSSSSLDVKSSILSFRVEICSDSCEIAP